ncbi:Putative signal transducing protein [Filimonas lacunae]|uniref:Putative signal transducing protein n=1 Tax=Filimonas lacunae TaxID=477680 RepID=A0A173MQY9_9BACT|nr:DUF2007 domain-containing protein [Filimonas lacunae]BAV09907.1 hypothetical protein FLA_5960 [Filimonas lacunae]SIS80842.1 Putative signal transducing protein [Filimonas lacunae]
MTPNSWFLLLRLSDYTRASIVKGLLEENLIQVLLLNKQDSSYLNFGEIEIYVPVHLKDFANQLLNKALLN